MRNLSLSLSFSLSLFSFLFLLSAGDTSPKRKDLELESLLTDNAVNKLRSAATDFKIRKIGACNVAARLSSPFIFYFYLEFYSI